MQFYVSAWIQNSQRKYGRNNMSETADGFVSKTAGRETRRTRRQETQKETRERTPQKLINKSMKTRMKKHMKRHTDARHTKARLSQKKHNCVEDGSRSRYNMMKPV